MNTVPHTSHFALVPLALMHRNKKNKSYTIEEILQDVCDVFDQPVMKVVSLSRKNDLVRCRFIFSYVSVTLGYASLSELGRLLGRHHSTVLSARSTVQDYLDSNDSTFMPHWHRYLNNSKLFTPGDFGAGNKPENKQQEVSAPSGRVKGISNQEQVVEKYLNAKV